MLKTALFIDGANIHASCKKVGYDIDYAKLKDAFTRDSFVLRATYYTALLYQPDGTNMLRPIIDYLEYNGYSVVSKDSKTFKDSMGLTKIKGNMDIEIAVDCMAIAEHVDSVILFSGDGDFTYLVKMLQHKGVHVTVVSAMELTADELRRQADVYLDMNDPRVRNAIRRNHQQVERV
jgi:uncharacterized LabA/DUF88 family protein